MCDSVCLERLLARRQLRISVEPGAQGASTNTAQQNDACRSNRQSPGVCSKYWLDPFLGAKAAWATQLPKLLQHPVHEPHLSTLPFPQSTWEQKELATEPPDHTRDTQALNLVVGTKCRKVRAVIFFISGKGRGLKFMLKDPPSEPIHIFQGSVHTK